LKVGNTRSRTAFFFNNLKMIGETADPAHVTVCPHELPEGEEKIATNVAKIGMTKHAEPRDCRSVDWRPIESIP
jgi:hypothetical protein